MTTVSLSPESQADTMLCHRARSLTGQVWLSEKLRIVSASPPPSFVVMPCNDSPCLRDSMAGVHFVMQGHIDSEPDRKPEIAMLSL